MILECSRQETVYEHLWIWRLRLYAWVSAWSRVFWLFHDVHSRFSLRVILVVSSLSNRDLGFSLPYYIDTKSRQFKKNPSYTYKFSTNVKISTNWGSFRSHCMFWIWKRIIFKEINLNNFEQDVQLVRVSSKKRAAVSGAMYSFYHNLKCLADVELDSIHPLFSRLFVLPLWCSKVFQPFFLFPLPCSFLFLSLLLVILTCSYDISRNRRRLQIN